MPIDDPSAADAIAAWERYAVGFRDAAGAAPDAVVYAPDGPTDDDVRLLGDVEGKRVLELGCGAALASLALARRGAHAIGVDVAAGLVEVARERARREGVSAELRHGDLADLAFVRADGVDLVFSAYALGFVADLPRVFRQVHRVLRPGAPLVFSVAHPAALLVDARSEDPLRVRRAYSDRDPLEVGPDRVPPTRYPRTVADLHTSLTRNGFRVDALVESEPSGEGPRSPLWHEVYRYLPSTLVVRARKEGI